MNVTLEAEALFNRTLDSLMEANYTIRDSLFNQDDLGYDGSPNDTFYGDGSNDMNETAVAAAAAAEDSIYFIEPHPDPQIAACANLVRKADLQVHIIWYCSYICCI